MSTYLFLHVPKAAGTSYGEALGAALGGRRVAIDIPGEMSSEEFQQVDPETLRQYTLVTAHVDYGLVRRAPWLQPITVLRDPVERIVSWYHYVLRDDGEALSPWRRFIEARRLSVQDFLLHPQLRSLHGQAQTMQLAGYLWSGDPLPHVDRLVGIAAENLATCAHVGLFERLGDSLRLARAELGLDAVPELPGANVSPARDDELDPEVRSRVAEVLGMDSAFYPLAVAEFERRLAAHGLDGTETSLPPPERPAWVRPPLTTVPTADGAGTDHVVVARGTVGDWIELTWSLEPGTTIGGPVVWPLPVSAPAGETQVVSSGESFRLDDDAPVDLGTNWLSLPAGVYEVQATVPCRRFEAHEHDDWDLLVDVAWYGDPPIPYVSGLPGAPDLTLWLPVRVPVGLPKLPMQGAPVSVTGVLRVPEDGGHLCLLLGSSHALTMSPGDQVRVRVVRIG